MTTVVISLVAARTKQCFDEPKGCRIGGIGIVETMLLVLVMSHLNRRAVIVTFCVATVLLLSACGSEGGDQAQVDSAAPIAVPTTPPLEVPTPTPSPVPSPTSIALPAVTSTPLPAPTVAPTTAPTPTVDPAPSPTTAAEAAPAASDAEPTVAAAAPTAAADPTEVPTPLPTQAAAQPEAEAPTAVVAASGEAPLECYDRDVQVYRAHVDGVDALSFEEGRVFCSGAGTNAVSAANSYRHSSGIVVERAADFILNDAGTSYIPYSGSLHFCVNGQPASAPVVADTVPSLLVVIDAEAQSQVAQGATAPAAFTGGTTQC